MDGKFIAAWATEKHAVRVRVASPAHIGQASDIVVFDDRVGDDGKATKASVLSGLRLMTAGSNAFLLLATSGGIRAIRIKSDGTFAPATIERWAWRAACDRAEDWPETREGRQGRQEEFFDPKILALLASLASLASLAPWRSPALSDQSPRAPGGDQVVVVVVEQVTVEQVTVVQVAVVSVAQLVVPQAGPPQNSVPQPPQSWTVVPQLAVDVEQLVPQTCTAHEVTLPPPLSMTSGLQA